MNVRCRAGELREHLSKNITRLGIRPEQLDMEFDSFQVIPGGLNETEFGVHYANFRYRSVFFVERLPQRNLALFALLVQNFLDCNDDLREKYELGKVSLDVISLDRGRTVEVACTVEFVDEAYLVEDPEGPIELFGTRYHTGEYAVMVAESLDGIGENINDPD